MTTALQQLLGDSLDYAGLYPPTSLPLAEALRKYVNYQEHPQAWMLARFVCPVARLAELGSLLGGFSSATRLRLAVLGRLDKAGESALAALKTDLDAIAALRARLGDRVRIETYEAPLPIDYLSDDPVALAAFLSRASEQFRAAGLAPLSVFLEADSWAALQAALVNSAEAFVGHGSGEIRWGWKIRLGGAPPFAMPTTSDVARFIAACRDAGCVWKATAGLHQPLGAGDGEGGFRFGFLSLLAAATLAQTHDLKPATIQQILEEPDRASFRVGEDALAWRDITASGPQIATARQRSQISFGSCSFDEPLDGLRELNLLAGTVNHV